MGHDFISNRTIVSLLGRLGVLAIVLFRKSLVSNELGIHLITR